MFNLRRFKTAQQRGQFPPSTLPTEVERVLRRIKDQDYSLDRKPGDGEGQKLTTPGSEGMLGDNPDAAGASFGSNDRKGYPDGISQYQDPGDTKEDLPHDWDTDGSFEGDSPLQDTHGGGGTNDSDVGIPNADPGDALSITDTALRNSEDNRDLDRKSDIATMSTRPRNEPRSRLTYNLARQNPMDLVRKRTR